MKTKILSLLFGAVFTCYAGSSAMAQYFQRWFNHYSDTTSYKHEVFYDGLCTRRNYSGFDSTNYYNVGAGFANVSTSYALGDYDELRFVRTDKSGIVLQNFGLALSDKDTTRLFNSHAHAVCEINNGSGTGGYMVVGNVTSNSNTGASVTGGSDALITRILNDGSIPNRWRFNFAGGADELNCVIASSFYPGSFYACGTSSYGGSSKVIVMKFNSLAKVIWAYTYHFDETEAGIFVNDCQAYGIAEDPATGNLLLVGKYKDAYSSDADGLLLKLGVMGNVTLIARHNLMGSSEEYRAIKYTADSNFIICGFSNKKATKSIYYDMWLTKISPAGGLFFSKLLSQPNSTSYGLDVVEHINASNLAEYYIAGSRYDTKTLLSSTSVIKTDNKGKGILSSPYDTLVSYNYHFMGIDYAAYDAGAPGITVFSNTFTNATRSDAYMLKANFSLATCTEYCKADTPVTYNVSIIADVLENKIDTNFNKKNLAIFKSKFYSGVICSEASVECKNAKASKNNTSKMNMATTPVKQVASLQQNVPNPFNQFATISYTLPEKFTTAQIVIADNTCKLLKHINVSGAGKKTISIDAGSLSAGIYSYMLIIDKKVIASKKMTIAK